MTTLRKLMLTRRAHCHSILLSLRMAAPSPIPKTGGIPAGLPFSWETKPGAGYRRAPSAARGFSTYAARRQPSSSKPHPAAPTSPSARSDTADDSKSTASPPSTAALPHLTPSGSAHMVPVSAKANTVRTAIATGTVYFSNPSPLSLIRTNALKKGDVLSVARIAGIMAAKKVSRTLFRSAIPSRSRTSAFNFAFSTLVLKGVGEENMGAWQSRRKSSVRGLRAWKWRP